MPTGLHDGIEKRLGTLVVHPKLIGLFVKNVVETKVDFFSIQLRDANASARSIQHEAAGKLLDKKKKRPQNLLKKKKSEYDSFTSSSFGGRHRIATSTDCTLTSAESEAERPQTFRFASSSTVLSLGTTGQL
jgi:hypothetical protein